MTGHKFTAGESFYSTYEALKQPPFFSTGEWRNKFLLYLWGIETSQSKKKLFASVKFLLYLWGIETIIAMVYRLACLSSFLLYLWGIETTY